MTKTNLLALAAIGCLAPWLASCTQSARDLRDPSIAKGYAVAYTTVDGPGVCGTSEVNVTLVSGAGTPGSGFQIKSKADSKGNIRLKPKLVPAGRYRVTSVSCLGQAGILGPAVRYRYSSGRFPVFTVSEGKIGSAGIIRVKILPANAVRSTGFAQHSIAPLPAATLAAARRAI